MTEIKLYRNLRNPVKFVEVHDDGAGHWSVVQWIWSRKCAFVDGKIVVYPYRQKTGDGCLHRWKRYMLDELLCDYAEDAVSIHQFIIECERRYKKDVRGYVRNCKIEDEQR